MVEALVGGGTVLLRVLGGLYLASLLLHPLYSRNDHQSSVLVQGGGAEHVVLQGFFVIIVPLVSRAIWIWHK